MLSKMIVKMFSQALEVALWISLIGLVGGGAVFASQTGEGPLAMFAAACVGFLAWVVFAVVFLGAFLILADIQKNVDKIASSE